MIDYWHYSKEGRDFNQPHHMSSKCDTWIALKTIDVSIRWLQTRQDKHIMESNMFARIKTYLEKKFNSIFHSNQCDNLTERAVRHKNAKYPIITCHSLANKQQLRVTVPLVSNAVMTKPSTPFVLHVIAGTVTSRVPSAWRKSEKLTV